MKEKLAVIDLGTNTFHLLIVRSNPGHALFEELYRERVFVKLAEEGIKKIGDTPFKRGLNALKKFKTILDQYQVEKITAFGTAGLRTAGNGPEFVKKVVDETGIQIQLISGEREAELIYKGVKQAVKLGDSKALIMDIGGGSVEFIFAEQDGVKWAQSFPIGVAVLYNNFHRHDPISNEEIEVLYTYFEQALAPMLKQLAKYDPKVLIGASGTFDILENVLCPKKETSVHGIIDINKFDPFFQKLLASTLNERLAMPEIPKDRAEMIIVALLLIDFILKKASIESISVSAYAMKEGMLRELMVND